MPWLFTTKMRWLDQSHILKHFRLLAEKACDHVKKEGMLSQSLNWIPLMTRQLLEYMVWTVYLSKTQEFTHPSASISIQLSLPVTPYPTTFGINNIKQFLTGKWLHRLNRLTFLKTLNPKEIRRPPLRFIHDLYRILKEPISTDTRRALRETWESIPAPLREKRQVFGRQYAGCGATLGAMPRCDFACRGCYLGNSANQTPPLPLAAIKEQLQVIREWLGEGGNVQLTDGEVNLREERELIELIRFAYSLGLIPMLMTHGEGFRCDPDRLKRLMKEGGLREISIHIDSTQRGRRHPLYRRATTESELMPLRDEFAELIRRIRSETGLPLKVATTITVSRENLEEVRDIAAWVIRNSDAFTMASFQPVAAVGRTEDSIRGTIEVEDLWEEIEKGMNAGAIEQNEPRSISELQGWMGHPACSRFLQGLALRERGVKQSVKFIPLWDPSEPRDMRFVKRLLDNWGGLTFRLDNRPQKWVRALGLMARHPLPLLSAPGWMWRLLTRAAPQWRMPLIKNLLLGKMQINYINFVSHHFMDRHELATPLGAERLSVCAFRVVVNGETKSMCEVNADGIRNELYNQWRNNPQTIQ